MADSKLNIIIGTTGADKLTTQLKGMKISFTEIVSALSLAQRGFALLQQGLNATVGVTVDYNKQIREMTQVTGLGAEEISRIVQVGDDWGISIDALRTSLGFMNKSGVTPSIDNLAKLADEYVATADKSAFAEKAVKVLGRGYQTLIPLLAKGGKALRDQAAAIDEGLIATDESIKAAREYEVALDDLQDSASAFSMVIGKAAIPNLTAFMVLMKELITLDPDTWFRDGADSAAGFINKVIFGKEQAQQFGPTLEELQGGLTGVGIAAGTATPYFDTFSGKLYLANQYASRGSQAFIEYGEDIGIAADKADDAKGDFSELLGILDKDVGSPIASFMDDLEWLMAGGGKINKAFETIMVNFKAGELTPSQAYDMLGELVVAANDVSVEIGQIDLSGAAQNIADALQIPIKDATKLITGTDGLGPALTGVDSMLTTLDIDPSQVEAAIDYAEQLQDDQRQINAMRVQLNVNDDQVRSAISRLHDLERNMDDETKNIYVNTIYTSSGGGGGNQRASGGPVTAGKLYTVGEQGPEPFVPWTDGYVYPHGTPMATMNAGQAGASPSLYIGEQNITINNGSDMDEIIETIQFANRTSLMTSRQPYTG